MLHVGPSGGRVSHRPVEEESSNSNPPNQMGEVGPPPPAYREGAGGARVYLLTHRERDRADSLPRRVISPPSEGSERCFGNSEPQPSQRRRALSQ